MDAKLIEARALIEAIIKRLDIAAYVVLHNAPGHVEIFHSFTPSYSNLTEVTEHGEAMYRLRSTKADYGGDVDAKHRDLEATVCMVSAMGEAFMNAAMSTVGLSAALDKVTGAKHMPLVKDTGPTQ
jgi:hypothetical protein